MKHKYILFILLTSSSLLALAQAPNLQLESDKKMIPVKLLAGMNWTMAINVSNSACRSQMPIGAVDSQGKAYVVWTESKTDIDNGPREIMFNTNRFGQWGTATTVNPVNYDPVYDEGFTCFAITLEGTGYFAYQDRDSAGLKSIFVKEYNNGTWSLAENISLQTGGDSFYASLAVSPVEKYLYAVFMNDTNARDGLTFRCRNLSTHTWGPSYVLPLESDTKYMPHMTVDKTGTLHLLYISRSYGDSDIWYAKNPEPWNINRWTSPIVLTSATGFGWINPRIVADNDGDIYIVWQDKSTGSGEILLKKTISGVWQPTENISQTFDPSEQPAIAVDPTTKEIYIAWRELVDGANWEVFMKQYEEETAGGQKKWSSIINFSRSQYYSGESWLVMDQNKNVHLFYVETVGSNSQIMYAVKKKGATPKPLAPLNLTLDTRLDASETKKINKLVWQANPDNANLSLKNYKIYRKKSGEADSNFGLVAMVSGTTLQYEDFYLEVPQKFAYRMTALSMYDDESDPTATVTETKVFLFPPLNPVLQTGINKALFYREKINTISFEKNPLNDEAEVTGYEIYRKKAYDTDDQYALIATLNSSTFSYKDRFLQAKQKYTYIITAVQKNGTKSRPSQAVSD